MNNSGWICGDCYVIINLDMECFTDTNLSSEKCFLCGKKIGDHHVVNKTKIIELSSDGKVELG